MDQRSRALRALVEQMRYGISAMEWAVNSDSQLMIDQVNVIKGYLARVLAN